MSERPPPRGGLWLPPHWHPAALIAFRFCFVYFGLYVVTTQMLPGMLPLPFIDIPDLSMSLPVRSVFQWVGRHLLGITRPIPFASTGSGDRTFDWVQVFTLLVIAAIATALWSARAREKENHARLFRWFRLFLRFALGTTMLGYGFAKAMPIQMPILTLTRLVEPFGNFSPMGVLWASIGASPAYEVFTGCAEICGGVLLFLPRTALLGALMCLMDTVAVFTLNMTYDVPVKLLSFHLALMSLFLIAPNARRLFDLFVRHRTTELLEEPSVGNTDRTRRRWVVAQVVFGVAMLIVGVIGDVQSWKTYGGGAPKSPLFGIWDVEQMTVDGQPRPPLLTDSTRWRRIIFQVPTATAFQRPNDQFKYYGTSVDTLAKTLTLTGRGDSATTKSSLSYQRPTKDRLLVDGAMDGHAVHMELAFRDPSSFIQRSRGFNWVQEFPFNR